MDFYFPKLIDIGDSFALSTFPEAKRNTSSWWINFISGAVAGAMSRTLTAPFDRLKTVMQVSVLYWTRHRDYFHSFIVSSNLDKWVFGFVHFWLNRLGFFLRLALGRQ
jgi:hypothetical protein